MSVSLQEADGLSQITRKGRNDGSRLFRVAYFKVTKVKEPSRFGAVVYNDQSGAVIRFVEKSPDFIANKVNAGLYVFNPSILQRIQVR